MQRRRRRRRRRNRSSSEPRGEPFRARTSSSITFRPSLLTSASASRIMAAATPLLRWLGRTKTFLVLTRGEASATTKSTVPSTAPLVSTATIEWYRPSVTPLNVGPHCGVL